MWRYILKRLLAVVPIVLSISIIGFISAETTSDPVTAYFGKVAGSRVSTGKEPTAAEREQAKIALGLDKPAATRYLIWLRRIVKGDLGWTFTGKRVMDEIRSRLPVSLALGVSSLVIGTGGGVLLGVFMARRQYSFFDYFMGTVNYLTISIPVVCLGMFCVMFFCVTLRWFPVYGLNSPVVVPLTGMAKVLDQAKHLALPSLILALPTMATWARFQRAAYLEVMRSDFIRTARSKGLSENRIAFRHALRNALLPLAANSGGLIMGIFGGSYIIETLFTLPGIGLLTTQAFLSFDYNLMLSTGLLNAVMGSLALLISDIVCAVVDPRIRYE